ncbi:non-ribosomal peptide synthetase [Nocardia arizonensis]|uniref:non-ribosomal peptide synthetase n=1 Tax=Nocardia arizonensis TaxID=1141647 RepID=UPI000A5D46CD|nr:non-ribosomal peptide synthetase [Nocardia arizonensis]
MNPAELVEHLRRSGVELWIDGASLRFAAPRGALDEHHKAALLDKKAEVMAVLAAEDAPVTEPEHRADPFPLTAVQASYLVGRTDAFRWGGVGCHGYAEFEVCESPSARLSADDFRRAWRCVLECHDMLRCVVHPDGYQRVELGLGTTETPTGLRVLRADEIGAVRAELAADLAHRGYRPGAGPMFDLVVTIGPDDTVVHFSIDLMIADFVSIALVVRDFQRCLADPAIRLPREEFGFRDYLLTLTRADRTARGRRRLERDRRYWRSRMADMPAPLQLPLSPRADTGPVRFSRRTTHLPAAGWAVFTERAAEHALTPTAALIAAFARVLGRYGDSDRFTLTLTTMNRRRVVDAVDTLVGDFTGTSVLAVDVGGADPFAALAHRVATQMFDDMDHAYAGGVEVLGLLAERDDGARGGQSPVVFTSSVGLVRTRDDIADRPTLRPVSGRGLSQTPQVLLDCQVSEVDGGIDVNWDSRDGAVPATVLDRAFADYTAALRTLSTEPAAWGRVLLPRTPPAPTALRPRPTGPEGLLHNGFLESAARTPDAVAVGDRRAGHTFAELRGAASRVATELRRSGVGRNDRVAIRLPAGPAQVAALLATVMAGAAYVPIDTDWPRARTARILDLVRPSACVDEDGPIARLLTTPGAWTPLSTVEDDFRDGDPADPAYIMFTSGTTGEPKGVIMTHEAVVNTIDDINHRCGITGDDAVLAVSRHTFDLSVYNIFGLLAAGGRIVFPRDGARSDPRAWLDAIESDGVTVWNSVPAQLRVLLDHCRVDARRRALTGLRRILLSGDWIPVTQPAEIATAAPHALAWSLGGATEAAIWSIHHRLEARTYRGSVPYGTALRDQSARVLTHRDEPAAPWQIGEIHIGGRGLAVGYLCDDSRTAASFPTIGTERLYRTGDFGRTDETGVIELIGRRDRRVKIHGHRIELGDVESAFEQCPQVAAAVACVLGEREHPVLAVGVTAAVADAEELRRRTATAAAVRAAAESAHRSATADLRPDALADFAEAADTAAVHAMGAALAAAALPPGQPRSFDEVAAGPDVATAHRPLLRRWIALLTDRGLITRSGEKLTLTANYSLEQAAAEWAAVRRSARAIDYGDELMAYVGHCVADLPRLLAGRADPLALLFPEAGLRTAVAAYRENLISRYLHAVLAAQVREFGHGFDSHRRLRVLEVGAGVGGTTECLLAASDPHALRYTFTDVSTFFLNRARESFGAPGHLDYALFDLNRDPVEQGLAEASFDLVVCANVLHNAHDIEQCLSRLARVLAPGGALALIDSTRVNPALMISMEFKDGLHHYTDLRSETESPFLTGAQWHRMLARSAFGDVAAYPPAGHVLEQFGQHLFWCFTAAPATDIRPDDLLTRVRELLPAPMVPRHVRTLSALPLSDNGKVDRQRVRLALGPAVADRAENRAPGAAAELDGIRARIAAIWADVLGLADPSTLTTRSDFFELGGDSLLLAQSIGRIRRDLPEAADSAWDELLRAMVGDPTLAGAERAVLGTAAADAPPASVPRSPLVRLGAPAAPPSGAPRPIAVLVHDGSGGLAPYDELVRALARHPAIPDLYGLRRVPDDGYTRIPPEELFTTLAARYARAIVELGPERVHLVGYCMGGLLAVEIARCLAESGITAGEVTVVSAYRVPVEIEDEDVLDYCFAQIMGVRAADVGMPVEDAVFTEAFAAARAAHAALIPAAALRAGSPALGAALSNGPEPGRARMARLARSGALGAHWTTEALVELRAIFTHSLRAVARYPGEPTFTDVRFLRQRGDVHFLPTLKEDMTEFWRASCLGDLVIDDIDGNHFDCLTGPNADAVARGLAARWQDPAPR